MSINNKLITFANDQLVMARGNREGQQVKVSLSNLEIKLKNRLGKSINRFIRFGSYTRNTLLSRKYDRQADVDLMVILNTDQKTETPGTYRKWILDAISKAYPDSLSQKDFPAVKLELNHITFDLVAAIEDYNWWGGNQLWIPDSGDQWLKTDPANLKKALTEANQKYHNNTVRNVVRLMKHWNASRMYPFASYLMEKAIVKLNFTGNNTYNGFLYALKRIAIDQSNTRQALHCIKNYNDRLDQANEWAWVQKLLPGV